MTKQEAVRILVDCMFNELESPDGSRLEPEDLRYIDEQLYRIYKAQEVALRALHFAIRTEKWLQEDEEENRK